MAINLGSAYGKVNIDSSGVKKGVGEANQSLGSMENSAKKLGSTLQSVGKSMTMSLTLPLLAVGGASIKAASDLEETRNKVKVVFGDMSDDVLKWGQDSAQAFGQSKQQALEAAGTFGNLFTSMGLGKGASADMSKGLVELAADLASFNNIDPALVLEKLRSGLVGEVEPLRTLGINLTMAATKTKALEMGLADASGEVSQAALLQARYALILEQSSNAQGDFARTSGGLANQSRILNAQWKDALATLGVHLLPIGLKVIQMLNGMLEKFNNLSPGMQKAIVIILVLVTVIGPLLFALGAIIPMLGRVGGAFNPFSGGVFGLIATFIKWIGVAALAVKIMTALGIATGPVGAGILAVQAAVAGVGASIAAVALPIVLIIGTLALLYFAFKNNWFGITTTVKQAWFLLGYYITQGVSNISVTLKQLWSLVQTSFAGWGKAIDWVLGKVRELAVALGLIKLPKALTPGSPTPFENGLRGIASAMDDLSKKNLPQFSSAMSENAIARTMAKPVQNMSSNSSTNTSIHLSNGLTLRDVDDLMNQKISRFTRQLDEALGGG